MNGPRCLPTEWRYTGVRVRLILPKYSMKPWLRVLLTAWSIGAVILLTAAGAIWSANAPAPSYDVTRTRASVLRVGRLLREPAPKDADYLEELARRAMYLRLADRQAGFWPRPDGASSTAVWTLALRRAHQSLTKEVVRRDGARQRWQQIEPTVARAVNRANEELRTPGLRRLESKLAHEATIELATARRFAAEGAHERAVKLAESAIGRTEKVHARWAELHARFARADLLRSWQRMVTATLEEARRPGRAAIVVDKLERRLEVWSDGRLKASFQVDLGGRGLERKLHSGDRATPEGRYRVVKAKVAPNTKYYKAFLIDYPNAEDRVRYQEARRRGEVPHGAGIGNLIEIHGDGGRGDDWTEGCIALTNADMDRLFRLTGVGTPVTIVGTLPKKKTDVRSR